MVMVELEKRLLSDFPPKHAKLTRKEFYRVMYFLSCSWELSPYFTDKQNTLALLSFDLLSRRKGNMTFGKFSRALRYYYRKVSPTTGMTWSATEKKNVMPMRALRK